MVSGGVCAVCERAANGGGGGSYCRQVGGYDLCQRLTLMILAQGQLYLMEKDKIHSIQSVSTQGGEYKIIYFPNSGAVWRYYSISGLLLWFSTLLSALLLDQKKQQASISTMICKLYLLKEKWKNRTYGGCGHCCCGADCRESFTGNPKGARNLTLISRNCSPEPSSANTIRYFNPECYEYGSGSC